jgi:hypothetical protein
MKALQRESVRGSWRVKTMLAPCFGAALMALGAVGCDGDNPPTKAAPPAVTTATDADYSIKAFYVQGDKRYPVKFGPSTVIPPEPEKFGSGGPNSKRQQAVVPPPVRTQGLERCAGGGGCGPLDTSVVDRARGAFTGETLLMAVADACVRSQGHNVGRAASHNMLTPWGNFPADLAAAVLSPGTVPLPRPWSGYVGQAGFLNPMDGWFVFRNADAFRTFSAPSAATTGCDQILARQEALLCTASRLTEIADAVGTTEIEDGYTPNGSATGGRWVFPVQDVKDKFILRDMAIATLGHLALLETELPSLPVDDQSVSAFYEIPVAVKSCSDVYVKALSISDLVGAGPLFMYASFVGEGWLPLPHVAPVGEPPRTPEKARELIAMRAGYKTNIFRAAGRLLRDLIDKSVQADIAGAERRRADAGDPVQGLELMWGADGADEASKHNSMRHAFRVLFGRLDWMNPPGFGVLGSDCPGVTTPVTPRLLSPDEVFEPLGSGFSARWRDRPPQTASQSLALSLLTQSGVLLPTAADPTEAQVRNAVAEQLVRVAAKARGVTLAAFLASSGSKAITETIAKLPLEDLKFALQRNLDAYRQLVDAGPTITSFPSAGAGGLVFEAAADRGPTITTLGGTVVKGGVPRQDLHVDMMGLVGGARLPSQCIPTVSVEQAGHPLKAQRLERMGALQSPFVLAHTFQTRLRHLASGFDSVSATPATSVVVKDAGAAATELRTWAGPGLVVATDTRPHPADPQVKALNLFVLGLKPQDIGAKTVSGMGARLAVVRGAAWKADCVAGIRSNKACPANRATLETGLVEDDAVEALAIPECSSLSDTVTINGVDILECDLAGYFGSVLRLPVDMSGAVPSGEQELIHLVQRPDGSEPGRVLSTFFAVDYISGFPEVRFDRVEVISDYQRDLLNQAVGTGSPSRRSSTCGDVMTTAIPDNYCIPGMQRDMFVPLSNELTSDGGAQEDSWKHYLSLAESAAAQADALGQQLIEAGKERELRREGAQEALAGVCGTYADIDSIQINSGEVAGDQQDEALNACINPKTVDLVFLTVDPFDGLSPSDAHAKIKASAYCTTTNASRPKFCDKAAPDYITHGGMDFPTYVPPTPPSTCDAAFALAKDVASGMTTVADRAARLSKLSSEGYVSRGGLFAGFGGIALTVLPEVDGQGQILWEGRRYGKVLLAPITRVQGLSAEALKEIYPACIDAGGCKGTAENLRRIFSPDGAPAQTHTQVRHKIEAALFHLGAIAGNVPEGTFTVPVPVYNANSDNAPTDAADSAMGPAIYGHATFVPAGNGYSLEIVPNHPVRNEEESVALGSAKSPVAAYWQARKGEDEAELAVPPPWRRSLYQAAAGQAANAGTYLTVQATSPALFFNKTMQGRSLLSRKDNIQQWVRDFASELETGCVPWENASPILQQAYVLNDLGTPAVWGDSSSDAAPPAMQRNICHSLAHPVFYENTKTRELHLRTHAWHASAGPKAFKEIIEDIDNPNDAMHKERAGFFEPFSRCNRQATPTRISEDCIRWSAYTEGEGTLRAAANSALATRGYYVPSGGISGEGNFRGAVENRLQPTTCTPGERAELFLNRYPSGSCEMGEAVIHALALACALGEEPVKLDAGDGPPAINSQEDLPRYEAWLELTELQLGTALNDGFYVGFPEGVLARHLGQKGFTSGLGEGDQGQAMLSLASQIEQMHSSWSSMTSAIRNLRAAVRTFRLELSMLDNQSKLRKLGEKREALRLTQEIVVNAIRSVATAAASAASFVKADFAGGAAAAAEHVATQTNMVFAGLQLTALDEQRTAGDAGEKITEERSVDSFNNQANATFDQLDQALTGIRSSSNGILTALAEVRSNARAGAWEVAKATGSDFAEVEGQRLPQHVNTVLNRQYNILRLRYERALAAAKRSAYLARLSMEQRLGVRLAELREPIGPLSPPASWVENLCSVQGIDYEKLRQAGTTESAAEGSDSGSTQEFANQFIGDYVAQLREFIEFYNVEFPFRQADDNAVLSLREDLLVPADQCESESANELYHSGALYKTGQLTEDNSGVKGGWSAASCEEDGCLYVKDGKLLKNGPSTAPVDLAPPNGVGSVSWLYATNQVPTADPGSVYNPGLGQPLAASGAPSGVVYQTVPLRAGRFYVLSWWDMARSASGRALEANEAPQAYYAGVYDKNWQLVTLTNETASNGVEPGGMPALGARWSERRELTFTAFDDGDYHIAFAPSGLGERSGSLAIANVQLEEPDRNLSRGSAYQATGATRTMVNSRCKAVTKEQLRAAFVRRCEGGRGDARGAAERCFYELNRDILIDEELHGLGFGGLDGQISQDNYNLRIVDVALNVVGTGVLDCSNNGSEACYASAFIEYDLDHTAFNAPIVDYNQQTHCFNFAKGSIKGGKALTAERYITLPLGSGDQGLIGQTAFRKTELFGRPLSGLYKLRIKDNPALVWENVEDIQFIVGHRYWSRVARP